MRTLDKIAKTEEWWLEYLDVVDITKSGHIKWKVVKPLPPFKDAEGPLVPVGFVTDLGTIPQALWWLPSFVPWSPAAPAYVHHDWDYATEMGLGVGIHSAWQSMHSQLRKMADDALYWRVRKAMDAPRAHVIYQAVRKAGWWVWWKHTPESVLAAQNLECGCCCGPGNEV